MKKLFHTALAVAFLASAGFDLRAFAAPATGAPAQASQSTTAAAPVRQTRAKRRIRARRGAVRGRATGAEQRATADLNRQSLQKATTP
jgi:hypothetical protein